MRNAWLILVGAFLLPGCGGGGGDDDGDSDWSYTFISGGGTTSGGAIIIVTGQCKAAPAFDFGEPFPFAGEVPPPDPAARAVPSPQGFEPLDAVAAPIGLVQLLRGEDGSLVLLLEGELPQPVPIPAVRILVETPSPLALLLLDAGGTAVRADLAGGSAGPNR